MLDKIIVKFCIEIGNEDIPFAKILTIGMIEAILNSSVNDDITKATKIIETLTLKGLVRILLSFFIAWNEFIPELLSLDFL